MDIRLDNKLVPEIEFLQEFYNKKAVTTCVTALITDSKYLLEQSEKVSSYARKIKELEEQVEKLKKYIRFHDTLCSYDDSESV